MRCPQSHIRFVNRSGLSIIEIIVVLVCLIILAMVLVPYIQQSRESQRLVACQNRIRNLAFAIKSDADDHAGRFLPLTNNDLPWTAGIMPLLQVSDQILIKFDEKPMAELEPITVIQLLCPNGQQYAPGKSCYILNGGWGKFRIDDEGLVYEDEPHTVNVDLNGDGEVSDE
ncbi:type II secretion system GspH family protein, partial [Planctomycetaceae bacterium]|nr:type II secretion system GspH family protein [Planctomycetaceae bacterium]